jgi:hypothetical protein
MIGPSKPATGAELPRSANRNSFVSLQATARASSPGASLWLNFLPVFLAGWISFAGGQRNDTILQRIPSIQRSATDLAGRRH